MSDRVRVSPTLRVVTSVPRRSLSRTSGAASGSRRQAGLRDRILRLAAEFHEAAASEPFVPGETYLPVSGKVVDGSDLVSLIDSALDMWLTAGRFSREFELALARRIGRPKACATASGSAANLLAFSALTSPQLGERRILPGSEVITVAAGFPTTVAPIVQNGCVPVFVDVDLATHNIDVSQLEAALSTRTRAVMVAHTLGNPFNLDAVSQFVREHDLFLIEDTCDALGATFRGRNVGTFGHLSTVSFYPAHHITTGEGGVVLGEPALMKIVESFRDWGRDCWCEPGDDNTCGKRFDWQLGDLPPGYDHKYTYSHIGYNLKMTDMQAAVGVSQLKKLDSFIEIRRRNHAMLDAALRADGLEALFHLPQATPHSEPSWFGYVLTLRDDAPWDRNRVVRHLEAKGVGTRLLFGGNLVRQPAFRDVEYRAIGSLTSSDKVMRDSFWVGVWPGLDEDHIRYMADTFRELGRAMRA